MIDKEKEIAELEQRVLWLQENIAPDDIYLFAEQALMAAEFMLGLWSKAVNAEDECAKCKGTDLWVRNILNLKHARDNNHSVTVRMNLKTKEEL